MHAGLADDLWLIERLAEWCPLEELERELGAVALLAKNTDPGNAAAVARLHGRLQRLEHASGAVHRRVQLAVRLVDLPLDDLRWVCTVDGCECVPGETTTAHRSTAS